MKMNFNTPLIAFIPFLLIALITSGLKTEEQNNQITPNSIGELSLCQNINKITLPFVRDTTFGGDGFSFYGKYYGWDESKQILADIFLYDSTSIITLKTQSPYFKTKEGLKVGSSFAELASKTTDLRLESVVAEYEDLYFCVKYAKSRIEFRLNQEAELHIYGLGLPGPVQDVLTTQEKDDLLKKLGNSAFIREISVVETAGCYD